MESGSAGGGRHPCSCSLQITSASFQPAGPVVRRPKTMTGRHRRILVVEDDPETARQLVESLTSSGYEVDLAATGGAALSRGLANDYAVVTIDRMLPDIDGIAVMQQLRNEGVATPFLIVSA